MPLVSEDCPASRRMARMARLAAGCMLLLWAGQAAALSRSIWHNSFWTYLWPM